MRYYLILLVFIISSCESTQYKEEPVVFFPDGIIEIHMLVSTIVARKYCKKKQWPSNVEQFEENKRVLDVFSFKGKPGSEVVKTAELKQTVNGLEFYIPYAKPEGTYSIAALHKKPGCGNDEVKPIVEFFNVY